ncbi:uncharacterized protein BX664DRAFT_339724 [Halteromyces radiatus]|uniref:uncharacterized protein n=1 Tax=Halteromyces radiatus TaxID=101107 RepID=UPI00221E927B|nr:uncharacterized protein BX664DRAFT_339724 [Halteromyces radiatus]KAI8083058.1 hypothetical protein BX664DRAFT_339724 [Halteromyces radiatus]
MEKYSRWRDPGTGIQPFLPPVPPRTENSLLLSLSNVIHYIVGPIQGIIKFTLVTIVALLYLILVPLLGTLLIPLKPLQRVWKRIFTSVCLRLILFFMGFFYFKSEPVSIRKGRNKASKAPALKVNSGDIIVTNWTSYIEVIYLAFRFNPVFTQVIPSVNKVRRISLWQAIRSCVYLPVMTPEEANVNENDLYTVKQISSQAKNNKWGPVIIFPEATTSNGRALLKFSAPLFNEFKPTDRDGRFHVIAFKYEYSYMSPTYTVGYQLVHLLSLCSQFSNTLRIKHLLDDETPCANEGSVNTTDLTALAGYDDLVGGQFLLALGNVARLRKTNLDVKDKRSFLDYYYSGNKKKQLSNTTSRKRN